MFDLEQAKQDLEEQKRLIKSMLGGINEYLERDDVTDIMLNPDGYIWIDTYKGTEKTIKVSEEQAQSIMRTVAKFNNKELDNKNPIISGTLPTGERFEGLTGEITYFKTVFSIRKKASRIMSLDEYEETGFITKEQKEYITESVKNKRNILVIGGAGSGKTTFTNACLDILKDTTDRIIMLEDTDELQCPAPNQIKLKSTAIIEIQKLLQSTMRMNPIRIIVGELRRGKETLELLKAWNSGHSGGLSTIHADDCRGGLLKLKQYIQEETEGDSSITIANSVHVLINIVKEDNKRYVREIMEIKGYSEETKKYELKKIYDRRDNGNKSNKGFIRTKKGIWSDDFIFRS